VKLKYIDSRKKIFINLKNYPKGKTVKKGDEIVVTDKESQALLKMQNGKHKVFEVIKETDLSVKENIESVDIKSINLDSNIKGDDE